MRLYTAIFNKFSQPPTGVGGFLYRGKRHWIPD